MLTMNLFCGVFFLLSLVDVNILTHNDVIFFLKVAIMDGKVVRSNDNIFLLIVGILTTYATLYY